VPRLLAVSDMKVKNKFSITLLRAGLVPLTPITISHLPWKLRKLATNLTDLKEMHTNEIFFLSKLCLLIRKMVTNRYLRILWHCTDMICGDSFQLHFTHSAFCWVHCIYPECCSGYSRVSTIAKTNTLKT
jgi:hypothetical protein